MDKQLKILYEVYETSFEEGIELDAYVNRWGQWAWVSKGTFKDPLKLGVGSIYGNVEPRFINNKWYWVRIDS